MSSGYVIIPRSLFEDKIFKKGKANETFAFIDLVQMAEYQDSTTNIKGQIVPLSRGELAASVRLLSERWGWSVNAVTHTLDTLERYNRIKRRKSNLTSIISIVNYDQYQTLGNAGSNAEGIAKGNADKDKLKEYKGNNKKNKKNIEEKEIFFPFTSEAFMSAWNILMQQPKWIKKPNSALQLSLDKISKYDEAFAIMQIEAAIEKQWAGLVYPNTDEKYREWQQGGTTPTAKSSKLDQYKAQAQRLGIFQYDTDQSNSIDEQ